MSRIRITDIARIANVSAGTVDRVIHNRPGVSDITRKHVQKILEEYNYQPDIIAGALASGRILRFLICMPNIVNAHAFWKFPETGIKRALAEIDHFDVRVEYIRFDQHSEKDFIRKISGVEAAQYDGLLFAPVFDTSSSRFIAKWQMSGKPVVLFNSKLDNVHPDGFIGQKAWNSGYLGGKLMNFGLTPGRDVLIVNLSYRKNNYQHIIRRERGFRAFFEEHTERVNNLVTLDINGGNYQEVSRAVGRKMNNLNVAGIFVTNSRVHLVARYLADQGIMNLRLIGYDLLEDNIEYLNREYIDFLISQSPEEQAYIGIRQLFNNMVLKIAIPDETILPIDILTKENIEPYLKYNLSYE